MLAAVSGLAGRVWPTRYAMAVAEQGAARHPDGRGADFRHALMREAVEAELLPAERVLLHADLAAAITHTATGRTALIARWRRSWPPLGCRASTSSVLYRPRSRRG
jgi:hypothetical protein